MHLKKISVLLYLLTTGYYGKCQTANFTETEVLKKYERTEENNINAIQQLYDYSKQKGYKNGVLRGLVEMQKYYMVKGDYSTSAKYFNEAEKFALSAKDSEALSAIYLYKGQTSAILDLYKDAKTNLAKSVSYAKKIKKKADKQIQMSNIYANFAGMYEGEDSADSILYYLQKSLYEIEATPEQELDGRQRENYYYFLIFGNMNLCNFYTHIQQPPKLNIAENYLKKTLDFSKTDPQYFNTAALDIYYTAGSFYYKKGDYKKGIEYFNKALETEKKNKDPRKRLFIYEGLKDSYDSLKNISIQNRYLKLYSMLNDSINRNEKKSIVEQSQAQIKKSAEKFKDDSDKSLKKILIVSTIFVFFILATMSIFFQKRNKRFKNSYTVLIEKLKNENDRLVYVNLERNLGNNEAVKTGMVKKNISTDTERRLLKKLLTFENSGKFLKKEVNLTSLSHLLNTNPKYLSEIIRTHKQQNFSGYINCLRINYIIQKLYNNPKYREYKISYLAEECGYTSPQVFVIAFKKETGLTPSYFIENLKR